MSRHAIGCSTNISYGGLSCVEAMESKGRSQRHGKVIHSSEREIIKSVIQCCDEEAKKGCLLQPLQRATARAAKYTGVSERAICSIRKASIERPNEPNTTPGKSRIVIHTYLAMTLLPPTVEQLKKMNYELNPTPAQLKEDLQTIREWLKKQPHLPHHCDDVWLERFMYGCKFSMERTKTILDAYYTVRAGVPEFFQDRDPLSEELKRSAKNVWYGMLPKLTPSGYRVTVLQLSGEDADLDLMAVGKRTLMMMDVCLQEARTLNNVVVVDLRHFTAAQMAKGVPTNPAMRRILLCAQDAFPMRLAQMHFVNAPPLVEKLMAIAAPLLKDKLTRKFYVHSQVETLWEHIPKEMLPKEYGGDAGPMKEISDMWMQTLVKYRSWFQKEQARSKADESKRPNRNSSRLINKLCINDVQGSFRQLSID